MPKISVVECDVCTKLSKNGFTVTIESENEKFSYAVSKDQSRLVLVVCKDCMKRIGEVFTGALQP